jgi:hypothetical protein
MVIPSRGGRNDGIVCAFAWRNTERRGAGVLFCADSSTQRFFPAIVQQVDARVWSSSLTDAIVSRNTDWTKWSFWRWRLSALGELPLRLIFRMSRPLPARIRRISSSDHL